MEGAQEMEYVIGTAAPANCVGCTEKLTPSYLSIQGSYKYGYVNTHGELIIPRIYDHGEYFSEGGTAIVGIGTYYGTIDQHGAFIIPMKYSSLRTYKKTNFIAASGGSYGIINAEGKELLPFIYDNISVEDDYLVLEYQNKKGLYDFEQKKWVLPAKYTSINTWTAGSIMCKKENDKIDWYDKSTLTIIDSTYTRIDRLSQGYFLVRKNNLSGVVDSKNTIIVPIIYQEFSNSYSSNSFSIVKKNDKYGIITYDNRVLVDFVYDNITAKNDVFIVKKNDSYGIVDKLTFKETTPCIYEDVQVYNSQRIFAKKNGMYGIIKYDGTVIEGFVFSFKNPESNQTIFKKGNKYGLIDYNYNFITDGVYDEIRFVKDGYYNNFFLAIKGKEKTLLDSKGIFIANVSEYDDVMSSRERGIIVMKNKKYGMIEKKTSAIIVPIQYDLIVFDSQGRCFVSDKGLYYELTFDDENKTVLVPVK